MMFDLFSRFDYSINKFVFDHIIFFFGILWLLFFIVPSYYFLSANFSIVSLLKYTFLFKKLVSHKLIKYKYFFFFFVFAFIFVVSNNLWGLFPYIFVLTSQITIVSGLRLVMFLRVVLSRIQNISFLYKFYPNSPFYILPFLHIIEIVSFLIRPVTLRLRLAINITTGHILSIFIATIMYFFFFDLSLFFFLFLFIIVFFFAFEMAVSLIQGFVYTLLLHNYFEE